MKKITLSACALAFSLLLGAQNQIHVTHKNHGVRHAVEKTLHKNAIQDVNNLFTANELPNFKSGTIPAELLNEQVLSLDSKTLASVKEKASESLLLTLPYKGKVMELELIKQNIFAPGFKVATNLTDNYPVETGVHYRGVVKGEEHGIAAISFFNGEVAGLIATDEGNFNLGKIDNPNNQKSLENQYVLYNHKQLSDKLQSDFCQTVDEVYKNKTIKSKPVAGYKSEANCVNIYFEMDNSIHQAKGGVAGSVSYLEAIFNQVAILYQNEQINVKISEVFVWETSDPYGSSVSSVLSSFRSNKNSSGYNGDLAHYVTFQGSGGIAYVDVICNTANSYGVSNLQDEYANVPTYSWDVEVITHELGHNLGSPHTHSCSWPGGPIDNCYSPDGFCGSGPAPTNGGTIMSYCHLTSHGINFNHGFGPLPGNLIRDKVYNASCLSECDMGGATCSTPLNISASNIGQTDMTITWGAVSTALNYEFRYRAQGGSWITSTEAGTSKNLTGLSPLTNYDVEVRSNCEGENSDWSSTETFTTLTDQPTYCSSQGNNSSYEYIQSVVVGTFTNNSGNNGGYEDFTTSVINITKEEATAFTLTPGFGSSTYNETWKLFADLNKDGDFTDAGETLYTSSNTSSAVSGSITIPASAINGTTRLRVSMKYNAAPTACETFSYGEVEDYTINIQDGVPQPCDAPTGLATSNVTTSSVDVSWNAVGNASSYLLQHREAGGSWNTQSVAGTSATVSGLTDNTVYDFRVASDCGSETSAYSNTVSVTTEEEQAPVCETPVNLQSSNVTTTSFTVSWDAVSGASGYTVEFRLAGGSWSATTAATNSIELTGGTPNTTYEVRVKADCGFGESEFSAVISVTTDEEVPVCDAPTNVQASNVDVTSFDVSWTAVSGAVGYVVEVRPVGGSWTALSAASNSLAITGLDANTAYEVRVQTECAELNSAYSSTITVTTDEEPVQGGEYCESSSTNSSLEWIKSVRFGSTTYTTNNNGGYLDNTATVINFTPGGSIFIQLNPGFTSGLFWTNSYPEYWNVYIDFNQDGDFDDAGELWATSNGTYTGSVSGTIAIPSGVSGTTRMRVSMKRNTGAAPCETYANGEVEDYTVNFGSPMQSPNVAAFASEETGILTGTISFGIAPNPTSDVTKVNLTMTPQQGDVTVTIMDITGRTISAKQIDAVSSTVSQQVELNLSDQAPGTYMINVKTTSGESNTQRLIKY